MSKPTADDFIRSFERYIAFFGPAAFDLLAVVMLYSDPPAAILKELFGASKASLKKSKRDRANKAIADRVIKKTHAFRLESTRPGKVLDASDLYQYFIDIYAPDNDAGVREADKVWIYLSRKFTQELSGKVETAVCGADKGRVFRSVELPELVLNSKIKSINGVQWKKIKDLYFSDPMHGPEKAFRLICLSELRLALRRARDAKTSQAVEDYCVRKAYYQIERREALKAKGITPPAAYKPLSRPDRRAEMKAFKAKITSRSGAARPTKTATGSPPKLTR